MVVPVPAVQLKVGVSEMFVAPEVGDNVPAQPGGTAVMNDEI